jgi:hypothetical protein
MRGAADAFYMHVACAASLLLAERCPEDLGEGGDRRRRRNSGGVLLLPGCNHLCQEGARKEADARDRQPSAENLALARSRHCEVLSSDLVRILRVERSLRARLGTGRTSFFEFSGKSGSGGRQRQAAAAVPGVGGPYNCTCRSSCTGNSFDTRFFHYPSPSWFSVLEPTVISESWLTHSWELQSRAHGVERDARYGADQDTRLWERTFCRKKKKGTRREKTARTRLEPNNCPAGGGTLIEKLVKRNWCAPLNHITRDRRRRQVPLLVPQTIGGVT